jgi:hypothetical protein
LAEQPNQEELARRYLLGGLSETEQTTLEEQILSDDEVFENLEIAEGELIDRYVRDELSAEEQRRVRQMIINSPRLTERVEIAKILTTRATAPAPHAVKFEKKNPAKIPWWNLFIPIPQSSPALRLVAVAPLALLLLTSVLLVLAWTRYRTESQRWAKAEQRLSQLEKEIADQNAKSSGLQTALTQTQQEKTVQEKLIADLQQQLEEQRGRTSSIFTFFINPGVGTRGGGNAETSLRIPPGKNELQLQLNVEGGGYPQYEATLQDADLKPILKPTRLKPIRRGSRNFITFKVAVRLLPPGSYHVHVDGFTNQRVREDFNDYHLRVTR